MQTGSHVEIECLDAVADRGRASDAARGAIKGRENSVTRELHRPTTEPLDSVSDDSVVSREQLSPPLITHRGFARRRINEVRKQKSGENPVELGRREFP